MSMQNGKPVCDACAKAPQPVAGERPLATIKVADNTRDVCKECLAAVLGVLHPFSAPEIQQSNAQELLRIESITIDMHLICVPGKEDELRKLVKVFVRDRLGLSNSLVTERPATAEEIASLDEPAL